MPLGRQTERANHLQQALLDLLERQPVDEHLHERRVDVAPDDARLALRQLVRVRHEVRLHVGRRRLRGAVDRHAVQIPRVLHHHVQLASSVLK